MAEGATPDKIEQAIELFQDAHRHQMKGDLDRAIELYLRSIVIYPTAEGHTFLGWAYSFQGRLDEAIEECKRAIEIDPDFGNPYNDIGAYLIDLGCLREAIPWLERAMRASRYECHQFPHFNLGRVHEALGDVHRAKDCYRKALAIEPSYDLAAEALWDLIARLN